MTEWLANRRSTTMRSDGKKAPRAKVGVRKTAKAKKSERPVKARVTLKDRVKAWGLKHHQTGGVRGLLLYLLEKKGMTREEIGRKFSCSGAAVRWLMRQVGIKTISRVARFEDAVKKKGYKTPMEYFLANPKLSLAHMARDLGVNQQTVSKHHKMSVAKWKGRRKKAS
jgi:DNA invertase Pin-like site-specific DNA recombinase